MTKVKTTESQWITHYQQATEQGLSLSKYAERNRIPKPTIYSAVERLRKKGLIESSKKNESLPSVTFVKATVVKAKPSHKKSSTVVITLPGSIRVEFAETDSDLLVETLVRLQRGIQNDAAPN